MKGRREVGASKGGRGGGGEGGEGKGRCNDEYDIS